MDLCLSFYSTTAQWMVQLVINDEAMAIPDKVVQCIVLLQDPHYIIPLATSSNSDSSRMFGGEYVKYSHCFKVTS